VVEKDLPSSAVDNWPMAKKLITPQAGRTALESGDLAMSVRYLLQMIEVRHPGGTVELRVPPFGAIQCIAGMDHRRGTPPNVVELGPEDFLELCQGKTDWNQLAAAGKLVASGSAAEKLRDAFPLHAVI